MRISAIIKLLTCICLSANTIAAYAEITHKLILRDAETGQPVINAAIMPQGKLSGGCTDSTGVSIVSLPDDGDRVSITMIGYEPLTVSLNSDTDSTIIMLQPITILLDEVLVSKQREHYSKKNNPAVELMENIRRNAVASDPAEYDFLNYDVYQRMSLGLTREHLDSESSGSDRLSFLNEYVEPSAFHGIPVLNISLKEKHLTRHFRRNPRVNKEVVRATRNIGLDDIIDQASMQVLLDDLLKEVDIYSNDISLLRNRFVSPLARIGSDYYKYYITDSVTIDNNPYIELSFVPRVSETFGFIGKMYVADDSTFFVKKITLGLPQNINLNFVDKLLITQSFTRDSIGRRRILNDDLAVKFSVVPGTNGIYARRNSSYSNYDTHPHSNPELYESLASTITLPSAYSHDESYWQTIRPRPLSESERRVGEMVARLRGDKTYRIAETAIKILINGYIPTSSLDENSKFDFGPWNTFISGNDIEGVRLRIGGVTTAALSHRWFAKAYLAYGTKDRKFKYGAEIEYSFNDKLRHSREFPIHSVSLSHEYDVDKLGQHYIFTSADNFVLSLTRMKNRLMTYDSDSKLKYTLELENHFSVEASIGRMRQYDGPYLPFITSDGINHNHFDINSFAIELRYAPGEKFYQARSERIPINRDAPVITLSHRYAPAGFLDNSFGINKTELSLQKRFWFSAFGYLDLIAKGGYIWNSVPYPLLLIPNANLSYTIQPESFALMSPMEFISDSDISIFATYWANGALLNRIPLINRLKLREVISFRGYLGSLSTRNRPSADNNLYLFPADALATPMHGRPYMEFSVGLDNIFKLFRLDYVWRLNYLDAPGANKSGARVALHFTF